MNIKIGSHTFVGVEVPILWGTRAILQDGKGRISVIDLSSRTAVAEIVGDEPADGVEFAPTADGFKLLREGKAVYTYSKSDNLLTSISLNLPPIQITTNGIRVGTNVFQGNIVSGMGVGLAVTEHGTSLGAPLPKELAQLVV